jgi:hypothetical protein
VREVVRKAVEAVDRVEFADLMGEQPEWCVKGCGREAGTTVRGRRMCGSRARRAYREDPAKRERDREIARRWKREHLGQPGRPSGA